jgi:hypothetical protein
LFDFESQKYFKTQTNMEEGTRTFVAGSVGDFGNVERTSFLGFKNSPVIVLDNGQKVALAGTDALKNVVIADTQKNLLDEDYDVPLDVRTVGVETMTAMGIDPVIQAKMFQNFLKLDKSHKDQFTQAWTDVASKSQDDQRKFVDDMIAQLGSG